jgi:hypothetical protein
MHVKVINSGKRLRHRSRVSACRAKINCALNEIGQKNLFRETVIKTTSLEILSGSGLLWLLEQRINARR